MISCLSSGHLELGRFVSTKQTTSTYPRLECQPFSHHRYKVEGKKALEITEILRERKLLEEKRYIDIERAQNAWYRVYYRGDGWFTASGDERYFDVKKAEGFLTDYIKDKVLPKINEVILLANQVDIMLKAFPELKKVKVELVPKKAG